MTLSLGAGQQARQELVAQMLQGPLAADPGSQGDRGRDGALRRYGIGRRQPWQRQLVAHQIQGPGLQPSHPITDTPQRLRCWPAERLGGGQGQLGPATSVGRTKPLLFWIAPGVEVQSQILGQGLGQARVTGLGSPRQTKQQFGQEILLR